MIRKKKFKCKKQEMKVFSAQIFKIYLKVKRSIGFPANETFREKNANIFVRNGEKLQRNFAKKFLATFFSPKMRNFLLKRNA